jgi:hypothetical protein
MSDNELRNPTNSEGDLSIDNGPTYRTESGENLSGYLYKKTKDGRWQKRWFESNGNFLAYYKSRRKEKLLAALSLPQTGEIKITTNDGESNSKQNGLFSIELNSRVYILQAKSNEEATKWVYTLVSLKNKGLNQIRISEGKVGNGSIPLNGSNNNNNKDIELSSSMYRDVGNKDASTDNSKSDWKKSPRMNIFCCW